HVGRRHRRNRRRGRRVPGRRALRLRDDPAPGVQRGCQHRGRHGPGHGHVQQPDAPAGRRHLVHRRLVPPRPGSNGRWLAQSEASRGIRMVRPCALL
ncbi:uncharacterized protein METZ01_LOCUS99041, partial [marine metagenome]